MADLNRVLDAGPFFIFKRLLLLKVLPPFFRFENEELCHVLVWVHLHSLPLELWSANCLSKILSFVGAPIRTESLTASHDRASFARALVKINAATERVYEIPVSLHNGQSFLQSVEYEFVPPYCHRCKALGHKASSCKFCVPPPPAPTVPSPPSDIAPAPGTPASPSDQAPAPVVQSPAPELFEPHTLASSGHVGATAPVKAPGSAYVSGEDCSTPHQPISPATTPSHLEPASAQASPSELISSVGHLDPPAGCPPDSSIVVGLSANLQPSQQPSVPKPKASCLAKVKALVPFGTKSVLFMSRSSWQPKLGGPHPPNYVYS